MWFVKFQYLGDWRGKACDAESILVNSDSGQLILEMEFAGSLFSEEFSVGGPLAAV